MIACASTHVPEEGVMGNTNWLASCESSDDCNGGTQCVCGVCTLECASDSECVALAGGVCDSSSGALESACGEAMPPEGLCLPQCSDTAPCGDGQRCVDNHCLPEARAIVPNEPDPVDREDAGTVGELNEPDPVDREDAGTPIACDDPNDCVAGALKVALLWTPHMLESGDPRFEASGLCPDGGSNLAYGGQVAQPIDVEVSLPLEVDISMLPPPPASLLAEETDSGSNWAVGHLVLYRDGDGNGLLDPGDLEHSSPDEVLGTSGGWGLLLGLTPGMTSHMIY
jgi:hypothetical protein